jgi:bacterioferritin-associated ferredoxin
MIICVCNAITEDEVRHAARCGAASAESAYARLGCEPQCGACLCYAQEVIDEELAAKQPHLRLVRSRAA